MAHRDPTYRVATVFGGAGFIGRHLVRRLAQRDWRVRVASRNPKRALFLKPSGAVGQIAPIYANIHDDASVAAAVRDSDYVINLVGILYESGRETFQAVHAEAAGRIARAARDAGAQRFVQVSAMGVSDQSEARYAQTKAAGEAAVLDAFPEASILRPSVIFGPEDNFFNQFGEMAQMAPFLPLIGGGQTRFQPVYVGDVADAIMACLDDPATKGRVYELGGPQVYTFKEILQIVLREARRRRLLLTLPWGVARLQARIFQMLPKPLLTVDQVTLLKTDNVASGNLPTLADLGIEPKTVEVIVPTYLWRFRPGGRFADRQAPA